MNIEPLRLFTRYARQVAIERGKARKGVHFMFHSLRQFSASVAWLQFIGPYYARFGFTKPPVHMVIKLTRSYGSKHLSIAEVVARLQMHYHLVASRFSRETVRRLLLEEPMHVCALQGKSGKLYTISLQHSSGYRQEGELTLRLNDSQQAQLQSLTFSMARLKSGAPFLWIGGLQGARMDGAKEQIVKATRDLHGLRPKTIMLESFYVFAKFIHVAEMRAIANHNHPFADSRKVILSDYDSFWEEAGGVLNRDRNFLLPQRIKRRTVDEVPSHKRKDWLKRQAHVQMMQADMKMALASLTIEPPIKIRTDLLPAAMPAQMPVRSQPNKFAESVAYLMPKPAISIAATLALGLLIGIVLPDLTAIGHGASIYTESAD